MKENLFIAFIALGLFIGISLMLQSATNINVSASPLFVECGVNTGC